MFQRAQSARRRGYRRGCACCPTARCLRARARVAPDCGSPHLKSEFPRGTAAGSVAGRSSATAAARFTGDISQRSLSTGNCRGRPGRPASGRPVPRLQRSGRAELSHAPPGQSAARADLPALHCHRAASHILRCPGLPCKFFTALFRFATRPCGPPMAPELFPLLIPSIAVLPRVACADRRRPCSRAGALGCHDRRRMAAATGWPAFPAGLRGHPARHCRCGRMPPLVHRLRLVLQRLGGGGVLLDQRRILLGHLVHLRQRLIDLIDAGRLLAARRRNIRDDFRHLPDRSTISSARHRPC